MTARCQAWAPTTTHPGHAFHLIVEDGQAIVCFEATASAPEDGAWEDIAPRFVRPDLATNARIIGAEVLTGAAAQALFDRVLAEHQAINLAA